MTVAVVAQPKAPLTGFGGWLIWLSIGQVLAIPRIIFRLMQYYTDKDTLALFQISPVAGYGELVTNLLYVGIVFYTTYTYFGQMRIFKKAFTIQALSLPLLFFFDCVWMSAVLGIRLSDMLNAAPKEVGSTIGVTIGFIPWVAYVWRSRRVENTFVK